MMTTIKGIECTEVEAWGRRFVWPHTEIYATAVERDRLLPTIAAAVGGKVTGSVVVCLAAEPRRCKGSDR